MSPDVAVLLDEALSCFRVESRRACDLTECALALCKDDKLARAHVLRVRAMAHGSLGEIEAAHADFTQALALARECGNQELEGHCLHGLSVALHHQGMHREAIIQMYQAIEIRRETGNLAGLQISLSSLAAFQGTLGNYPEAIAALTEALELVTRDSGEMDEAQARTNLALVYLESGQVHESLAHFEEALALYARFPCDTAECNTLFNYSNALLAAGRQSEALAAAERSYELARKHENVYQEIKAQIALGSSLRDPLAAERALHGAYEKSAAAPAPRAAVAGNQGMGDLSSSAGALP